MSQQKFCLNRYSARSILLSFSGVVLTLLGILTLLPTTAPKDTSAAIDPETYDLYLSASPVEITAGNKGDIALGKSTITSTTLSPAGYELYLSMTSDSNAVRMDSVNSIAATTGTFNTPTALTTDTSASWGYAIAGLNNFDSSYNNISQSSKFAAVPTVANPQLIHNHSGASANGSNLDIYFGVRAAKNTPSGQYTADIMISSISDMTSEPHKEAEVTEGGELEEGYSNATAAVRTSLKATSITFAPSDLIVKIDGKVCNNVAVTEQIPLSITASVPNGLPEGEYDVEISIPKIGRTYVVEKGIKVTAPAIPKTAKALLGANGNLSFVYDTQNYRSGEAYTDNLGETTISSVYSVPTNSIHPVVSYQSTGWSDSNKVLSANFEESFYDFEPTSTAGWFTGNIYLARLTNGQNLNTSKVTDMSYMFSQACSYATSCIYNGIDEWDTSSVTNMGFLFNSVGYSATKSLSVGDIKKWDVSKVTTMESMFNGFHHSMDVFSLDLSGWDTSLVTNMAGMFSSAGQNATDWSLIGIDGWNTSSVTNMRAMFGRVGQKDNTFSLDLGNWDVSNVTDMEEMFYEAGKNSSTSWSLTGIANWNTGSVTNMESMFSYVGYESASWNIDELSNWDTSSVTDMGYMFDFSGYSAATWSIGDLSNWDTSSVTDMDDMFYKAGYNAETWSLGDIGGWNVESVKNMFEMFGSAGYNATTWYIGDLSDWRPKSATALNKMFQNAGHNVATWNIGNIGGWDVSSALTMQDMFSGAGYNATTWYIGDLSGWNVEKLTNASNMFQNAGYKSDVWNIGNIGNWNTDSLATLSNTFYCAGYNATTWYIGDLSGWNTSKVTSLGYTFYNAGYNATEWSIGDISSWDTSKVREFRQTFDHAGYKAPYSLDLSGWSKASVVSYYGFNLGVESKVISPVWK